MEKDNRALKSVDIWTPRNYSTSTLVVIMALFGALILCGPIHGRSIRGPLPQNNCPDLIQLIKKITPVVVNIQIERHMLQSGASQPPPLFRAPKNWLDGKSGGKPTYQLDSLGSGFIVDPKGYIITNAHVVEAAVKILVTLSTGKVVTAKVVAAHDKVDLALIKIDPPYKLKTAQLGDSESVEVGEWVLAVGNPFGLGSTATFGIVSGKGRFIGLGAEDNFIQTDASINPGNSGGPLFNMEGRVIGVNTAVIASGKGIGFSIPSEFVRELVTEPSAMGKPTRAWLGVYVEEITREEARRIGLNGVAGAVVDEVIKASPAHSAGLKKGDIILEVNNELVRNGLHLSRLLSVAKPGELMRMRVIRNKKSLTIDVVLGKTSRE
jgi:serine protease Do